MYRIPQTELLCLDHLALMSSTETRECYICTLYDVLYFYCLCVCSGLIKGLCMRRILTVFSKDLVPLVHILILVLNVALFCLLCSSQNFDPIVPSHSPSFSRTLPLKTSLFQIRWWNWWEQKNTNRQTICIKESSQLIRKLDTDIQQLISVYIAKMSYVSI